MKINEFADFCKTTPKTLRFYDQKGLLPPDYVSPENGYRHYHEDSARRFHQIEDLKKAGLSLHEIQSALDENDCSRIFSLLEEQIQKDQERIDFCRKLRQEYIDFCICNTLPDLPVTVMGTADRMVASYHRDSFSFAAADDACAAFCSRVLQEGNSSDNIISQGYESIKELLEGHTVIGTQAVHLPAAGVQALTKTPLTDKLTKGDRFICHVISSPEEETDDLLEMLDYIPVFLASPTQCIWSVSLDFEKTGIEILICSIK